MKFAQQDYALISERLIEGQQADMSKWERRDILEKALSPDCRVGKHKNQDIETSYRFELTNGRPQKHNARTSLGDGFTKLLSSKMTAKGMGPWAYSKRYDNSPKGKTILDRNKELNRSRRRRGVASLSF